MAKIPPALMIQTPDALNTLVSTLSEQTLIGIDTESNSLHAYRERVCLIQISTRTADFIVDPLAVPDLHALGPVLADPRIEKVFHAAEYDLMCLKRDFNFEITNLFDTMVAARICGYKLFGLGNLLEQHVGVVPDKSHQRDNWGKRPLPPDSLHYAQMDTHYLPRLRDILRAELESHGHMVEALEAFEEVCANTPAHDGRTFDPDGYWALALPNRMHGREVAILRELFLLREALAEARDVPPFKVFTNQMLVEIARKAPSTFRQLREDARVPASVVRRYGDKIIAAIKRGNIETLSPPPLHQPPPAEISERYIALHTWRKKRAQHRGVESDVIVSKQTLWSLAYLVPTSLDDLKAVRGLGPWKLQHYGAEILDVIAQHEREK